MLDNLRQQASSASLFQEEPNFEEEAILPERSPGPFLGMTPMQRFIIAIMLLITIGLLGTLCLLVTGRFGLF